MYSLFLVKQSIHWQRKFIATAAVLLLPYHFEAHAQRAAASSGAPSQQCQGRVPQFEDITAQTGIKFQHQSDPQKKYIVESMSGGVLLADYDRDGWLDIYFTNAPTVEMAVKGQQSRGALYHNNQNGTFTDVTEKSGLTSPCFAMGGAVGY